MSDLQRRFAGDDKTQHFIVHLNDERETVLGTVRLVDGHWRAQPDTWNVPTDELYGSKEEAAASFPLPTLIVSLAVENHYELHGQIDTKVNDVRIVPPPPTPEHDCPNDAPRSIKDTIPSCAICDEASEAYSEWSWEQINALTGTGREDGDAAYFVKVTKSSDESVLKVGTEFEFGT